MAAESTGYALVTDSAGRGAVYESQTPQAIYHEPTATTYVAFRGDSADPFATAYDHTTGEFREPTRIGENPLPDSDNHGPPAICLTQSHHIVAFYGSHGGDHHVARSRSPADVSEWVDLGPMTDVPGGTYPFPVTHNGDIYVLYRAGPSWYDGSYPSAQYGTIARSQDRAESFTDLGPVLNLTGYPAEMAIAYVMDFSLDGGQLHMTWTVCHDHAVPTTSPSQHRSGVFHATFDPDRDTIYDLSGAEYGSPLTWTAMRESPIEVFPRQDVNHPKHAHLPDGPAILFPHYDEASPHTTDDTTRIEWLVSVWDDRWSHRRIDGAYATHLFDGGYPRVNERGEYEAYIVTGGDTPELVDGGRGGDLTVATLGDDGFEQRTIVTGAALEAPVSRVTTVRNGRDEFSALFQPASSDATDFDVPLYAYGTAWDPDAKDQPG